MQWIEASIVMIIAWLVGWGTWVTKRLLLWHGIFMTRAEHEKLCEKHDAALVRRIDSQELEAREYRKEIRLLLQTLVADVAVLKDKAQQSQQSRRRT